MADTPEEDAAEALAPLALERFGHLLDDEQKEILRRAARQQQAAIDALRAFELQNADEPALTFAVAERRD